MKRLGRLALIANTGKVASAGVADRHAVDAGFTGAGTHETSTDLVLQTHDLFNLPTDIPLLYQVGKSWHWTQVECVHAEIKGNTFAGAIMPCVEVTLLATQNESDSRTMLLVYPQLSRPASIGRAGYSKRVLFEEWSLKACSRDQVGA